MLRSKIEQYAASRGKTAHGRGVIVRGMDNHTRRTAIVIGCGIGGPTVAMALQRAGIEPRLYEAHPGRAEYAGSFLNLASNGIDALRALDADRPILAAGFPTPRMVMWSGTGKRLGEVSNGIILPDGTASLTIRRGLLHGALRDEALRRGLRIEHGKRLVAADTRAGRAVARFEDGTEVEADVLIGADGLHSRVREILDPHAPAPRYTGQLSFGGFSRSTALAATPDTFHMIFGKRGFFGYSVRPSGEAYWFANMAVEPLPERDSFAAAAAHDWKRALVDLFEVDDGPAVELIEATEHELGAFPIHDMPKVPVWHRGSIALIGDSAHATSPSSGQGASMAIEDAVVLAQCLRDIADPELAFTAYERARRARVERVVRYSARVGRSKVAGPLARFFRDLMMPAALKVFARSNAQAWMYRHHIDWNAKAA